jgi:C-terminal processing protease CtpA/Prc
LTGPGKAWFDDFTVTIDGQNIEDMEPVPSVSYAAEQDTAFAQSSQVILPKLTAELTNDLGLLGRVWGFLKYHHPAVATGQYHWDKELFRILPDYLRAGTQVQRESVLSNWIERIGPISPCDPCAEKPEGAVRQLSVSELTDRLSNPDLVAKLQEVYTHRPTKTQYYVAMAPMVGNPVFRHEDDYPMMSPPDVGYRLLSLYRYWNMIHYFFPYVEETDRDWDEVLTAYIPQFVDAQNDADYEYAVLRLIAEVNDTHANLWSGAERIAYDRGSNYAAVHLRYLNAGFTVADYYNDELKDATGLEIGDVIQSVDGRPVDRLIAEWKRDYPASNPIARRRNMAGDLLRSREKQLVVTVLREGRSLKRTLPLYPESQLDRYRWIPPRGQPAVAQLPGNIGYINLQNITPQEVDSVRTAFISVDGLIIDIRNYPATFVPFTLGSWLLDESTPFVKFTAGSVSNPGTFVWRDPLTIPAAEEPFPGPVVVLVNEYSQSAAEYTAMAFRASQRTPIVGSTTAGADGNVSRIRLPGGLGTMISGIGVFYPDGSPTQRVGIVPDIYLKPSPADLRAGRDPVLERAVAVIRGIAVEQ